MLLNLMTKKKANYKVGKSMKSTCSKSSFKVVIIDYGGMKDIKQRHYIIHLKKNVK